METNKVSFETGKIQETGYEEPLPVTSGSVARVGNVPESSISRSNIWPTYDVFKGKIKFQKEIMNLKLHSHNTTIEQRCNEAIADINAQRKRFDTTLDAITVQSSPDERALLLMRLSSQFPLFNCAQDVLKDFDKIHIELVKKFADSARPLYSKFPFLEKLVNNVASKESFSKMLILEALSARTCSILSSRYGIDRAHPFRATAELDFIDNFLRKNFSPSIKFDDLCQRYEIITGAGKKYLFLNYFKVL